VTPASATVATAAPGPSVDRGCTSLIVETRKQPDNAEGFFDLGKCYYNEGRFNDSVAAYNAAITINAEVAKYFEGRGLANWKNSSAPRGINDLNAAIALKPKDASLYESRGQIYLATRNWQGAMDDYDKATRINSKSKRAWLGLAEAAEQNGSPEIAESAKAQASALP
jgi:cytochrome c-type biogenesis protein CcmH/NrfG